MNCGISWVFHATVKGRSSLRHCLARSSGDAVEQCQNLECLAHSLPHHIELGQCPCNSHSLEPKIAVSLASRTPLAVIYQGIYQGSLSNPCYHPVTHSGHSILLPQFLMHSANRRRKNQIHPNTVPRGGTVFSCPMSFLQSHVWANYSIKSSKPPAFTNHEQLPVVTLWPAHGNKSNNTHCKKHPKPWFGRGAAQWDR